MSDFVQQIDNVSGTEVVLLPVKLYSIQKPGINYQPSGIND